jgi:hypothetical protein
MKKLFILIENYFNLEPDLFEIQEEEKLIESMNRIKKI